jgi:hypothetical protein
MNIEVNIDTSHSLIDGIGHAKRTCRVLHPTASRQCWCSSKAPCRASTPTRGVLSSLEVDMKLNCSVIKYRGANCNSNRKNESAAGGTLLAAVLPCCCGYAGRYFFFLQRQTQNLIDSNVADFDDENKSTYMLLYCSLHCLATQSIQ